MASTERIKARERDDVGWSASQNTQIQASENPHRGRGERVSNHRTRREMASVSQTPRERELESKRGESENWSRSKSREGGVRAIESNQGY